MTPSRRPKDRFRPSGKRIQSEAAGEGWIEGALREARGNASGHCGEWFNRIECPLSNWRGGNRI